MTVGSTAHQVVDGSWRLRRRLGRSFGLVTAIAVLLLAVVAVSTVKFVMTGNSVVYRWAPIATRTQRLLTALVDQETGLRGYALTGDRAYLHPYDVDHPAARRELAELRGLIGGDHQIAEQFDALVAAGRRWQREVVDPAVRGIGAGDEAAVRLAASARAKQLFDEVRARAAALAATVEDRSAAARNDRRGFLVLFVTALAVALALLVIAGFLLWRGLHQWVLEPIDRLGRQTREVAGGDTYRQIVPDGPGELTELGTDVEAMRLQIAGQLARAEEIQEELRLQGEELARSNDDLQQFAYVASHDLSEPLRKVANFCQLLERQYGPQLDDRARQYIDFAVDGAKRMQRLISDLLALSRVGRTTEQFEPVDLNRILEEVQTALAESLAESGASIERVTELPTVPGDPSLLTSLFENLIGNAIKYRRDDVRPQVRIEALDEVDAWSFTVSDNGIGIDQEYAERIFVVFQRLHLRDKYGGTGIGLALCRKIVEFHGGHIWLAPVESESGATFRFTLPKGVTDAEPRD